MLHLHGLPPPARDASGSVTTSTALAARAEKLQGRIFHDFIWGGYLLYAWPEQKVFIDGGTDF